MLESSGRVQLAQPPEGDDNMLISCRRWKDDGEAVSVSPRRERLMRSNDMLSISGLHAAAGCACLVRQPIMNCVGDSLASYPGTSWPEVMECCAVPHTVLSRVIGCSGKPRVGRGLWIALYHLHLTVVCIFMPLHHVNGGRPLVLHSLSFQCSTLFWSLYV